MRRKINTYLLKIKSLLCTYLKEGKEEKIRKRNSQNEIHMKFPDAMMRAED
jgi:hypothetical protein